MAITVKTTGIDDAIKEAKDAEEFIPRTIKNVLTDVLVNDMLREAKINAKGRVLGRKSGRGTGNLAREIFHKVGETTTRIIGALFVDLTRVPYARIHEKGGNITPKRAKKLTIPLPGVQGFARDFNNTFIQKSKKGNLLIFQKLTGQDIRPLFALVDRVRIPRRPYLEPAIRKHKNKLQKELKKALNREG